MENASSSPLHFVTRGEGPPLMLIMGLGADGSVWEQHAKAYEKHFKCDLIDNRGVGRSPKPDGPYTTAMMADDVAALMNAEGIPSAHVAGLSMEPSPRNSHCATPPWSTSSCSSAHGQNAMTT